MSTTTIFKSVTKRTGEKVPYRSQKIAGALQKAFASSSTLVSEKDLTAIVQEIEQNLLNKANTSHAVHIEHIQDEIEQMLMKRAYFTTAKNFIIYRQKHAERRLSQTISKQEKLHSIFVNKRDGSKVPFNLNKILVSLRQISHDINTHQAPLDPILLELEKNIFEGITTTDIEDALILSTISFIERDSGYNLIASRLLRQKLYREVLKEKVQNASAENTKLQLQTLYRTVFINNIKFGVEQKYFSKDLLDFDLEEMSQALIVEQDELIGYLGLRTLYERYFVKDDGMCLETPQAFWMRVAMGLSTQEQDKHKSAKEFYMLISQIRYVPSTPTLFHSGLSHPQLSSCYISTVSDDLSNIFKCIGDNAQMAKWSGGIGNDWTSVRATNSLINSTNVNSQGIIPFLKIANDTTLAINRSGKRRGATCAYLETWHLDIEDFIDLRKNTGDDRRRTHDMNTANWIPDLFMKRVEADEEWTLFSPNDVPDLHELYGAKFESRYIAYEKMVADGEIIHYRKVRALKLWRKMLTRLFETGHPWITFKDPCNIRSPQDHVGVIHSSNLCTEITLNNSSEETAVCNLGSINLAKHVTADGINQYMLIETITTAMRMLDNVIDINFYPTKEAEHSNLQHRPVGLGIMGLQDALFTLSLPFVGSNTLEFMDTTMEFISYHAILSSSKLAKKRGAYASFKGSKWDRGILPFDSIALLEEERGMPIEVNRNQTMDWNIVRDHIQAHGMRNSNTMAIAPTATISNIAGCFPCIEPIYKNIYVKSNMSGEFTIVNEYLVNALKELGVWNPKMLDKIKYYDGSISAIEEIPEHIKELYKETFEIDTLVLLKLAAARAKWIDQSQSLNVFLKGTSGKKLHDTYLQAWRMGLKTTYYLRSLGASQIEKATLSAKEYGFTQKRVYNTTDAKQASSRESNQGPNAEGANLDSVDISASAEVAVAPREFFEENEFSETHSKEAIQQIEKNGFRKVGIGLQASSTYSTASTLPTGEAQKPRVQAMAMADATSTALSEVLEEFELQSANAASIVGEACSILDPDCEACQ